MKKCQLVLNKNRFGLLFFLLLWANESLAMQPCPSGTSPWGAFNISLLVLFGVIATALLVTFYKKVTAATGKYRLFLIILLILSTILLALGMLGLFVNISWVGTCV